MVTTENLNSITYIFIVNTSRFLSIGDFFGLKTARYKNLGPYSRTIRWRSSPSFVIPIVGGLGIPPCSLDKEGNYGSRGRRRKVEARYLILILQYQKNLVPHGTFPMCSKRKITLPYCKFLREFSFIVGHIVVTSFLGLKNRPFVKYSLF